MRDKLTKLRDKSRHNEHSKSPPPEEPGKLVYVNKFSLDLCDPDSAHRRMEYWRVRIQKDFKPKQDEDKRREREENKRRAEAQRKREGNRMFFNDMLVPGTEYPGEELNMPAGYEIAYY